MALRQRVGVLPDAIQAALASTARHLGVPVRSAEVLHFHSNAIVLFRSAGLVARVATNPDALDRVRASLNVTRWLAAQGFPCAAPADINDQPFVYSGRVVSVWQYLPTTSAPTPSGADLGRLLRVLHDQPIPPTPLRRLADPFASISQALVQRPEALPAVQRGWLETRIAELRDQWERLEFPTSSGLIHGDAHPGNLLRLTDGGLVLGDWDHVAIGPAVWDLAQAHYTHRRFGRPAASDLDGFAGAYGWDIRDWPGLAVVLAVREITGLSAYVRTAQSKPFSATELGLRVTSLQRQDGSARWHSPSDGHA